MTPLRFANPSPPSGWIRDLHPQTVEHARHTKTQASPAWKTPIAFPTFPPLRLRRAEYYLYAENGGRPAALDIASGMVLTECKSRHRHQEFLGFLKRIDEAVPAELDVHLIVDNYATHKHAKVRTWLSSRPRFHLHFTPTYSSWLNQVER